MRNRSLPFVFLLITTLSALAVPWHEGLSLANGGHWPQRVGITISNQSETAVAGKPVALSLPALTGTAVEGLRVCSADGLELLFDLRDISSTTKRSGTLNVDDKLLVPVDCGPQGSVLLFVYAGNAQAWPVPDFLSSQPEYRNPALRISIGRPENLRLKTGLNPKPALIRAAENWAEVCVRNLRDDAISPVLVRVNLGIALTRLPRVPLDCPVSVTSSEGYESATYSLGHGGDLLFSASLAARAERLFALSFKTHAKPEPATSLKGYERLLTSSANLIPDGSFETGSDVSDFWRKPAPGGRHQVAASLGSEARFGHRSLELTIGDTANSDWVGWNSREIRVTPGATYLLSGWIKSSGLKGSAVIHAHFHNAQGGLTKSGAMVSTQPSVGGSSDWANSSGFFHAPPDAATIQLHLTMNTAGTLWHDGLVLCEVMEGQIKQIHSAGEERRASGLQVWEMNPLRKVFPDTPPQRQLKKVSVELARNEYEPFQLTLRGPAGKATHIDIAVSPLKGRQGLTLPPVKIERVGFVPIDHPSAYYSTDVPEWCRKVARGAGSTDGWAGWWPDPLAPGSHIDVPANQTQPVWFTVHAPKESAPGDYKGSVTLRVAGEKEVTFPLTVRVLPFALPDQSRLRAIFDFRFGPGGAFGSGANSPEERKRWLRLMAEHRLGIDAIHPAPEFAFKDGKVTMDASKFDEEARFCFDELGMNVAYTPHFFYMFGWAYPPEKLFGFEPFTAEWNLAFKQAYQLFTEHIRQKGWHDKFVYYISDEPHFQHPFVVDQMKKLCALIHEVDATIPIYSSTWRHCSAWDDALDLWGIGQFGCFPVSEMERLQGLGKKTWFTCDGQMATDTPFLATERMLPYYCFKYGVSGFEFWGLNWWTYDPWRVGWHQFIRQSDEGKKYYWVRYPDGDGFLVYPGRPVGVEGPVSTIRLEQVREGLEDYEAITMLAQLAEKAKRSGKPSLAANRALQMARHLVTIPNAGGLRSSEILPEPERIPAVRKAVNAALVELLR